MEKAYRGYRDLRVYQLSYSLAMELFRESKAFPLEERFSLTDQIRRSTRSIPTNLAEGWKKRRYPKSFVSKVVDCLGEAGEVEVWLDFARDCGYLSVVRHRYFFEGYEEVSKMLYGMIQKEEKFTF
jgi:four helix bundle protein